MDVQSLSQGYFDVCLSFIHGLMLGQILCVKLSQQSFISFAGSCVKEFSEPDRSFFQAEQKQQNFFRLTINLELCSVFAVYLGKLLDIFFFHNQRSVGGWQQVVQSVIDSLGAVLAHCSAHQGMANFSHVISWWMLWENIHRQPNAFKVLSESDSRNNFLQVECINVLVIASRCLNSRFRLSLENACVLRAVKCTCLICC